MAAGGRRSGRLALLVLLPAAGLVGLGVVGLWQALRAVQAQAGEEARVAARAAAMGVRAALARPAALDLARPEDRFRLGPEGLEVPDRLGWVGAPPPDPPPSWRVRELLAQAEALEHREGRPEDAAKRIEEGLGAPGLEPGERQALALAAGWLARRRGGVPAGFPWAEAVPEIRPGALLLAGAAGVEPPAWAGECLARRRETEATALLDRAEELFPPGKSWDPATIAKIRNHVARAARERAVLRAVGPGVAGLSAAAEPVIQGLAGELLVYHPAVRAGALVAPGPFLDHLREGGSIPWSGAFLQAAFPPPGAAPLWPGAWVVPSPPSAPAWGDPRLLGGLLLLLALALLLGLALVLRIAARERQALRVRSDFLSSVTHELRTPLASVRLFSEMLLQDRVPSEERRRDYYRLLAGESGRLQAMVENVLDLGRLERGERAFDLRALPLAEVAAEAAALFGPLAARDGLDLAYAPPPEPAATLVRGDRGALLQVLYNLLENGRKYGAEGGVLRLEVDAGEALVRLRVRDLGPGVAPSDRERIFAPFGRGGEGGAGLGLGLHLSRRILEAHGGELRCVDPGGPGACFELTLPRIREEAP